jgi:hypothetical protein
MNGLTVQQMFTTQLWEDGGGSKCLQRHSVGYRQAQKVLKWPRGIWAETTYAIE